MYKTFEYIGEDVIMKGIFGIGTDSFGTKDESGDRASAADFDTENLPEEGGDPSGVTEIEAEGTEANLTRRLLYEQAMRVSPISYEDYL